MNRRDFFRQAAGAVLGLVASPVLPVKAAPLRYILSSPNVAVWPTGITAKAYRELVRTLEADKEQRILALFEEPNDDRSTRVSSSGSRRRRQRDRGAGGRYVRNGGVGWTRPNDAVGCGLCR